MKRNLLAVALSFVAGPAVALSCLPVSVADSYREAAAAEETYIVVHGRLEFDTSRLPKVDLDAQDQTPPQTDIPARLSGKFLSKDGFQGDFDRAITVRALCFGPWCGQPVSGADYMAFLEETPKGYVLSSSPCGGFDFAKPTPDMLRTVTQCMQGGVCQSER